MRSKGKMRDLLPWHGHGRRLSAEEKEKLKVRPYQLAPDAAVRVAGFAAKDCWMCKGTGISGWKNNGFAAVICRCVKTELSKREAVYAETQSKLKAQVLITGRELLAKLKESYTGPPPHRPCMDCQEASHSGDNTILTKTKEICLTCNGLRTVPLTDDEWALQLFIADAEAKTNAQAESGPAAVPQP
jgi:hypothetical protein